jgi:carbamate kinase
VKKNRLVIALGGNALGNTPSEQKEKAAACAKVLAELASRGYELILAHGNGPQVGMIHLGLSHAAADGVITAAMPLAECTALSQGYIGYHLQNALRNELDRRGIRKEAVTLLTQVVVDAGDKAFSDPTKPVGAFYSREEAERLSAQEGFVMKEDAGRGWRRVVPSPKPADIVEKEAVMKLAGQGCIVIAVGGGGIPVIQTENGYEGVAAVIDKDYASEKLAELTDAEQLIILTAVDSVAVHYGKPEEKRLRRMTVKEAKTYAAAGEFAPGSMLPKIEAACLFASLGEGRRAVIGNLDQALACAEGRAGTEIVL